jgi:hypothetical protein
LDSLISGSDKTLNCWLALFRAVEQSPHVTNATKKKRTWAGYACPVCRFVFRVPKDHDGVGVICPACRYLLKIPQTHEVSQFSARDLDSQKQLTTAPRDKKENKPIVSRPLGDADKFSDVDSSDMLSNSKGQRRRRKKKPSAAAPSWERQVSSANSKEGNSLAWIIGGSFMGLIVVAIGAWIVMDNVAPKEQDERKGSKLPGWDEKNSFQLDSDVKLTPEEQKVQKEIEESVNTRLNVLAESQKVVEAFLTAKTAEDLHALVRTPEVTVPRMQKWYASHEWVAPGAKEMGSGGGVTVKGVMASMAVRLNDYSVKHIAVERTSKGYLVDWESWVGWGEMDWAELFKQRPTEPVEIRVICSMDSYYNRIFKDDSNWLAVRMEYPNADRSIYGYIDRKTTTLTSLLGDLKDDRAIPVTIKIRYPKDSVADNQVYIEEYIQNGWVRPPEDDMVTPKPHE